MDVYFSDQVNDPTLRLFSSTKTLGSDTLDESISLKFEDDPVMSAAISAATGGSLMDISDMMQETQSDKASEHNYEDMQPEVKMNSNNYNGGEKQASIHQAHISKNTERHGGAGNGGIRDRERDRDRESSGNMGNNTLGGIGGTNDYDDSNDINPPMAHTPVYMPQHHNIDQVRTLN